MAKDINVEIVVYNIESAMLAQKGGAARIELCANPSEGGTTPSIGVIEIVRQALSIDVSVMIRPRGGDFVYSSYEYFSMKRDIEMCKRASVDGIVFGILTEDGSIDKNRCRKLIEQARPLKVTCHRAFDVVNDQLQALEDCIEVGFDRILTSGGQQHAEEGIERIKELAARSAGRIEIMPGSGVNENNVRKLTQIEGITNIHFSAATFPKHTRNESPATVSFASQLPDDWRIQPITDPDKIASIIKLIKE